MDLTQIETPSFWVCANPLCLVFNFANIDTPICPGCKVVAEFCMDEMVNALGNLIQSGLDIGVVPINLAGLVAE